MCRSKFPQSVFLCFTSVDWIVCEVCKESNNMPLKPDLTVTMLIRTVVMIVVVTAVVEVVVAAVGALKILVILEAMVLLMPMTAMAGRTI